MGRRGNVPAKDGTDEAHYSGGLSAHPNPVSFDDALGHLAQEVEVIISNTGVGAMRAPSPFAIGVEVEGRDAWNEGGGSRRHDGGRMVLPLVVRA